MRLCRLNANCRFLGILFIFIIVRNGLARETLWNNWWEMLQGKVPHDRAIALNLGYSYDWQNTEFALLSYQTLYDYDSVWLHRCPSWLKIRFEISAGYANPPKTEGLRFMSSGNFLAVAQLSDKPVLDLFYPYAEAGVGIIFTDFQRDGQGLRVNFNPQAGISAVFGRTDRGAYFIGLRGHHLSNAELNPDNRGLNSIVLILGKYF